MSHENWGTNLSDSPKVDDTWFAKTIIIFKRAFWVPICGHAFSSGSSGDSGQRWQIGTGSRCAWCETCEEQRRAGFVTSEGGRKGAQLLRIKNCHRLRPGSRLATNNCTMGGSTHGTAHGVRARLRSAVSAQSLRAINTSDLIPTLFMLMKRSLPACTEVWNDFITPSLVVKALLRCGDVFGGGLFFGLCFFSFFFFNFFGWGVQWMGEMKIAVLVWADLKRRRRTLKLKFFVWFLFDKNGIITGAVLKLFYLNLK